MRVVFLRWYIKLDIIGFGLGNVVGYEGRNEGNVLFNDALNTFYFTVIWRRTYGKGPLR